MFCFLFGEELHQNVSGPGFRLNQQPSFELRDVLNFDEVLHEPFLLLEAKAKCLRGA